MKNLQVREAKKEDAGVLNDLSRQLGYPRTLEETKRHLDAILSNDTETVFVVTDNGTVIAWMHIFYTIRLESGSFCELGGLVVDEQYRGRGIGKILVEKAMEWTASRSAPVLRLRSNVIRGDAHRFYRRLGFTESKEQKVFDRLLPFTGSEK